MKAYLHCLSAELLKARRTVYLLGSIMLPILLAVFNFLLQLHVRTTPLSASANQSNAWLSLFHNTYTLGTLIVFPVIFIFASTFTAHQEHDTYQWRRLLSMAVPRGAVYLAKVTFTLGLGLFSCLVMWAADILLGGLYVLMKPERGLIFSQMPVGNMLVIFLMIFALGMLMMGLQFFFSMRVNNFVLSIGVGLAFILAGMFFAEVPVVRFIYPWSLPELVFKADTLLEVYLPMAYSVLGFTLTALFNCRVFIHKDFFD